MLGSQEAVRMYIPSYLYYLSGSKPRMHSFEAVWWNSCSRFKHCAVTSAAPAIPADSSNADTATNALQQFVRIRSSLIHSSLVRRIILTDANRTSAGSKRGQPIVLPMRPAIFDPNIPAFAVRSLRAIGRCDDAWHVRLVPIFLQKSFCTGDQKFSGP